MYITKILKINAFYSYTFTCSWNFFPFVILDHIPKYWRLILNHSAEISEMNKIQRKDCQGKIYQVTYYKTIGLTTITNLYTFKISQTLLNVVSI